MRFRYISRISLIPFIIVAAACLPFPALGQLLPTGSQATQSQPVEPEIIAPPREFIRNVGQWDTSVDYGLLAGGGAAMLTRDGITLFSRTASLTTAEQIPHETMIPQAPIEQNGGPWYDVRRMSFVGASPAMRIVAGDTSEAVSHFYRGSDPGRWHEYVSNHRTIRYEKVWPGVDATLENTARGPRLAFKLKAGTPPERIRLKLEGMTTEDLRAMAECREKKDMGSEGQTKWMASSLRKRDDGTYTPAATQDTAWPVVTFTVDLATYLGGSGIDEMISVAVGDSGQIGVTGLTNSVDYPLANEWKSHVGGDWDRYLSVISCDGSRYLFSSYFGGSGIEDNGVMNHYNSFGLRFSDAAYFHSFLRFYQGSFYTIGTTESPDFPVTANALQPVRASDSTAFIASFTSDGVLSTSSFLGGPGLFAPRSLDVGGDGSVLVAGGVLRDRMWFVTPGSVQPELKHIAYAGHLGAAVVKLSLDLQTVRFGSYLFAPGGENDVLIEGGLQPTMRDWNHSSSLALMDDGGNVLVAGHLYHQDPARVPLVNPLPESDRGLGYAMKISADGASFVFSTTYGGISVYHTVLNASMGREGTLHIFGTTAERFTPRKNQFDFPGNPDRSGDCYIVFSKNGEVLVGTLCYSADGSRSVSARGFIVPDTRGNMILFNLGAKIVPTAAANDPGPWGLCGGLYCLGVDTRSWTPSYAAWLRSPNLQAPVCTDGLGNFYSLGRRVLPGQLWNDSCNVYEIRNAVQPLYGGGPSDGVVSRFRIDVAGSAFDCRLTLPDSVRISRPRGFTDPEEFDITVEVENMSEEAKRLWYVELELPDRLELVGSGQTLRVTLTPDVFAPGMRGRHSWRVRVRPAGGGDDATVRVRTYYGGLALPQGCPPGWGECSRKLELRYYDDIVPETECSLQAPDALVRSGDLYTPQPFDASYTLRNLGPDSAHVATLTLRGAEGMGVRAQSGATRTGRVLAPGEQLAETWQVIAERRPFARDVELRVTTDDIWGHPLSVCTRSLHLPAMEVYCRTGGDTVAAYYPARQRLQPDSLVADLEIENPSDTVRRILAARCDLSAAPLLRLTPTSEAEQGGMTLPARGRKSYSWRFELTAPVTIDTTITVPLAYRTAIDSAWHGCTWSVRIRVIDATVLCAVAGPDTLRPEPPPPTEPEIIARFSNIGTVPVAVDRYTLAVTAVAGSGVTGLHSLDPLVRSGGAIDAGNDVTLAWRLRPLILREARTVECTVAAIDAGDSVLSACAYSITIEGVDGLRCSITAPDRVRFHRDSLRYEPDPVPVHMDLANVLDTEETVIEAGIDLAGAPRFTLADGEIALKTLPLLDSHSVAGFTWMLSPLAAATGDTQDIMIRYRSAEQGGWKECRTSIVIAAWPEIAELRCATGGHDSIFADAAYELIVPDPLQVSYTATNTGTVALSGCQAAIILPPGFALAGSDSIHSFGTDAPGTLAPNESATRWWTVTTNDQLQGFGAKDITWQWTSDQQGTGTGCAHTVQVVPDPSSGITFTPLRLYFEAELGGALPAAQTVKLWTGGGLAMPWTAQSDAWYIDVDPVAGDHAGSISVQPNTTMLNKGLHRSTLTLGGSVVNLPKNIAVEYLITSLTEVSEQRTARTLSLGPVYPHPIPLGGEARILVRNPQGKPLRVTLHDLLGRERALLREGVTTDSDILYLRPAALGLSHGSYLLRVLSPEGQQSRMVTVVR